MTQSDTDPNVFTATIDIPEIGNYTGDPEYAPGGDDPKNGYYLLLSVSDANLFTSTRFTAPFDNKVVDIAEDETFEVTLLKNVGAPMIFVSYGNMALTFNAETYEFSAVYVDNTEEPGDGDNTGISAVENASEYVVYDLLGRKVISTTDRSALENIAAGIYVINGKKTVVK